MQSIQRIASCRYLAFQPKRRGIPVPSSRAFYIGGNAIEVVDKWPYLANATMMLIADISKRRNSLVSEINKALCYLKHLSPSVSS
jgi:hypothetical protein